MRQKLTYSGAEQLEYEIRNIVKKARQVEAQGRRIFWENIGDPIQKHGTIPAWIKDIISNLAQHDKSYGYCDSKGVLETREYLAKRTNTLGGVQITAEDILFFNGLGDAISKLYQYMHPSSRVIGPSPAYPTHSSGESSHANAAPLTYKLDPKKNWFPDLDDLYNKVKYNPSIVGILIINPDNPTGMVYPFEYLKKIVSIANEFDLMLVCDEIYQHITYNGARAYSLAEVIGDTCGISLKGISKELPWPGSRCGWMEFYNRQKDDSFDRLCNALEDAKMTEVCSTTLPQMAIPKIISDDRYAAYRLGLNEEIGKRAKTIAEILGDLPFITFNATYGAFYNTIVFNEDVLRPISEVAIADPKAKILIDKWIHADTPLDKQFAYFLLATSGVCVVPLSSFQSDLLGFRVTLLEEDPDLLKLTFEKIHDGILSYCASPALV